MAKALRELADAGELPSGCVVRRGTIGDVAPSEARTRSSTLMFSSTSKDVAELEIAASRVRPDGHLIVLAPAHQFLSARSMPRSGTIVVIPNTMRDA